MKQLLLIFNLFCFSLYGYSQDFNPMNYGAVGNGQADDTQAVQAAVNAAIAYPGGGGVTFPEGKTFAIDLVVVRNGIRYLRGGQIKLINNPSINTGFSLFGEQQYGIPNVKDLTIEDMVIDHNHGRSKAINGVNVSRVRINNVTFLNRTNDGYSIILLADSNGAEDMYDNVITNNKIYGVYNKGESIAIRSRIDYGGYSGSGPTSYWVKFKKTPPANYSAYNTIIANNYIEGGYYGIGITKAKYTFIENNIIQTNTRNISMQQETSYGVVRDNNLSNPISASIHVAQGSSFNLVENNTIITNTSSGEGLLQSYIGTKNNVFRYNTVDASLSSAGKSPKWFIYVAIHADNNIFNSNTFTGTVDRSYFGVETGWDSSISDYGHRGSYAGAVTNNYANQGISGLRIINNTLTPGNSERRILITEVRDDTGSYHLINSVIDNNTIVGEPNYCAEVIYDGFTSFDNNLDDVVDACTVNQVPTNTAIDCPDITNQNGQTYIQTPYFIPENVTCAQPLTVIEYSDNDGTVTYSISSASEDPDYFSIDQNGRLQFIPFTVPDFENPASADLDNSYMVIVEVKDNTNPVFRDIQIYEVEITDQTNEGFVDIQLSVILEGAYDLTSGEMKTTQNTLRGLLPGQTPADPSYVATPAGQPYNTAPWNYTGREGTGWTDIDYSSDIVDWVLVSFRTGIEKSTEVARTAALLSKDGSVQFPNCTTLPMGTSPVYIVIEHRNHMGVMSLVPVSIVNGVLSYDFQASDSYTTTGFGQKQLAANTWVMFTGDADQTDLPSYDIQGQDKILWDAENGSFYRYIPADFNLDGDINGADRALFNVNNGVYSTVLK